MATLVRVKLSTNVWDGLTDLHDKANGFLNVNKLVAPDGAAQLGAIVTVVGNIVWNVIMTSSYTSCCSDKLICL